MVDLENLLKEGYVKKASDIHFRSGDFPWFRIDGSLIAGSNEQLGHDDLINIISPIVPIHQKESFLQGEEVDFAWDLSGVVRFRINVYRDIQGIAACFRVLPSELKTVNDLKIEPGILELCSRKKGLILVTGPTGSGKTTTLAALLDYINILHRGHIITIEDPIEFIFSEKNCLIHQREINAHTKGFHKALRAALREDPDIVMVGEMRDLETTVTAMEVAETGHLVLSTLHTNSAASTIYRIINQFPKKKQEQIRVSLAASLIGVISQTLIPKASGQGRIAVREVLMINHAVANLIRENKVFQINNIMQMNRNAGMLTMNDAMVQLVEKGEITSLDAIQYSYDPPQLEKLLIERGIF